VLVSFAGLRLLSMVILHGTDNGWALGDTKMTVRTRRRRIAEEENCVLGTSWLGRSCGGKTAPTTTSHAFEWVRVWVRVIAARHHVIDKVENFSLDGIRDLTNHVPIINSSLSFFSLLFLSSSQSTISLRLLPPYAPRKETSNLVASYSSYRVRSPDPGYLPHRYQVAPSQARSTAPSED
jgi:hypothetical protein